MSYKPDQEPLMDWMVLCPMRNVTETRFLGGEYIRLYNYFLVLSFLFESGAVLGRAMCGKLGILEQMLAIPTVIPKYVYSPRFGHKSMQSLTEWQHAAEERLCRFETDIGRRPNTFKEFIFERELESTTGLKPSDALEAYEHGKRRALKAYKKKIRIRETEHGALMPVKKETQIEIRSFVLEGIGFGSLFPQLTEKANHNYWESVRMDIDRLSNEFSCAKDDSFIVPKLAILSSREQERAILRVVAWYAENYYPELLSPLGLKRYCLKEGSLDSTLWGAYSHWFSLIRAIDYFG